MSVIFRGFRGFRSVFLFLCLASLSTTATATQDKTVQERQALVGGTLISKTAVLQPNTTIVFDNGIITDVFSDGSEPLQQGTIVTDVTGAYITPGLIDTHVHLATDPSGADNLDNVLTRLDAATRGGVTTVRDMGGDARLLAYLARAASLGEIVSPDIFYSAIVAGPEFMADPRVQASARGVETGRAPWAWSITQYTNWLALAHEARGAGARGIKIYAAVPRDLVREVASAAGGTGLRVWAHGTVFPARPSDGVHAGVNVLSHAAYLIWEAVVQLPSYRDRARGDFAGVSTNHPAILSLLDDMAERGAMLDPTLFVFADRNDAAHKWGQEVTYKAWERGVLVTSGTDAMGDRNGPNLQRELELLVDAGLPPSAVLQAATINGARAIGIETDYGSIEPGKIADILVLNDNPLESISHTRDIRFVVRRGTVVRPD